MSDLITRNESLAVALDKWRAEGLSVVELTGDLNPRIVITMDMATGRLTWTAEHMNGLAAVSSMWQVLLDMGEQYFHNAARPKLNSGQCHIALASDGERIQLLTDPHHDLTLVRGLLLSALLELSKHESLDSLLEFQPQGAV